MNNFCKLFKWEQEESPEKEELSLLQNFLNDELERFQTSKEDALAYISTGETKIKEQSDPIKVAALATVINGIMNTSEGYTIR